jgi:predicted metal-dependent phosphoesterase TrpH
MEICMQPYVPFAPLTISPDAAIDFQMHTTLSDGYWTAPALLDHVARESFALVAITDHDRLDTVDELQVLAGKHGTRVIPAVEMSASWNGDMFDILCFGVRPGPSDLATIAETTRSRQLANVRETYDALQRNGFQFPRATEMFASQHGEPRHFDDLLALMREHSYTENIGGAFDAAGYTWVTADPADIVAAAHAIGALAIIAHPGRGDGFVRFDAAMLDTLRVTIPIDGLEAWHPTHSPEQVENFRAYASAHHLLVSAGSDSHGPPEIMPIKYAAESCRALLERLGIAVR